MATVTVIGANSYIARNLTELYAGGNDFFLYDRDEGHRDGRARYQQVDLLGGADWDRVNFDCDLLYLFTGRTGAWAGFAEYESFIDVNEKILLGLLEAYRRKQSRAKIIFPSTRLIYRGGRGLLAETAEKEFKTVYAMNKYSCENYLRMYGELFAVRYCVFRICVPYGSLVEGLGSYGTVAFFLQQARQGGPVTVYGTGEQRRTFTHIEDLCRVLWEGGRHEACLNDAFNIGGADQLTIGEVAEKIAAAYGVAVRHVPWPEEGRKLESGDTVFASQRLDRLLGNLYGHTLDGWLAELKEERQAQGIVTPKQREGEDMVKMIKTVITSATESKMGGVIRNSALAVPAARRFISLPRQGRLPIMRQKRAGEGWSCR